MEGMLTTFVCDIRFMHGIFILLDDDESPALDSENSWNPATSEAESDSVDKEPLNQTPHSHT